ncbi:GPI ethanolamine phosphate transferase 3-like [Ptychodera flava]|uniref:GPI ethanolamine phosphate transferase 3-like n=1 Tax=Ptychodera flava TaxID=63121 RepID=UPI003969D9AB
MRVKGATFFIIAWLSILYITGIVLFTKGFLLKRLEVPIHSDCQLQGKPGNFSHGCWMQKRYERAIIMVIDALRFDFTVYNTSVEEDQLLPFQNKLPTMHKLLTEKPVNSRLYRFLADPPTTTMQRLKGLTTGSLPTFVDAGSNFASSEIVEDNVINQFAHLGGNITFMGDDTWESLFLGKFKKSFPYPSFNVKDLHTVDNGIIEHLIPELKAHDWMLLISHFLGVDHCGHRFGPYHPAMAEKLTQMDKVIGNVIDHMPDDSVLFVFGDHGMTTTGDHGGDSMDELDAALFVYSPSQLVHSSVLDKSQGQHDTLSQIDLVPTISLLLGTPIPHSNLGSVITDLFTTDIPKRTSHQSPQGTSAIHYNAIEALRLNAHQVKRYIDSYSTLSDEFPYAESSQLLEKLEAAESMLHELQSKASFQESAKEEDTAVQLEAIQNLYMEYLSGVKSMCQRIWAKFDLLSMTCGIGIFSMAVTLTILQVYQVDVGHPMEETKKKFDKAVKVILVCGTAVLIAGFGLIFMIQSLRIHWISFLLLLFSISSGSASLINILLDKNLKLNPQTMIKSISIDSVFAILIVVLYIVSMTSNSFVVNEDRMCVFLFQSVLLVVLFSNFRHTSFRKRQKTWDITQPTSVLTMLTFGIAISGRLSANFRVCREEQQPWCENSIFSQSLSNIAAERTLLKNFRYFLSVACMSMLPICLRLWLSHLGNLNGSSASKLYVTYALPLAAVCVSFYWALQALPEKVLDSLPVWQQIILPRVVYVVFLLGVALVVWTPLTLFVTHKSNETADTSFSEQQTIHREEETQIVKRFFNHIKSNWSKQRDNESSGEKKAGLLPMVYGLATVYSASFLVFIDILSLVLTLLLGDGYAPSVLILLIQMFLWLELYSCICRLRLYNTSGTSQIDLLCNTPWYAVVMWTLMSSQYFFATGHQATVPSIRFESAFTGFHGDFPTYLYFVPALLIGFNTFAGPALLAVCLPLLLLWPFSRGYLVLDKKTRQNLSAEDRKGEFSLHENEGQLDIALFRLTLKYIAVTAIKFLGTMFSAAIHRRHLMVWKIFAPRFVFEGVSFLIVVALLFLVNLMISRIDGVLSQWFKDLVKKYRA